LPKKPRSSSFDCIVEVKRISFRCSYGERDSFRSAARWYDRRARFAKERDEAVAAATERAKRKTSLFKQKRATIQAEADYHSAKLARALAEIALEEYEEGTFTQDLTTIDGEIALAESDLIRAEDRTEWAKRMFEKGFVSLATKNAEDLGRRKAKFTLEQAQTRKKDLVDYTKAKTIKELNSAVEKARSDELAKMQSWVSAKARESELERQLGSGDSR
jgi:hypothetical protein